MNDRGEVILNPTTQDGQGIVIASSHFMHTSESSRALNPIIEVATVMEGDLRGAEAAEFLETLLNAPAGMVTSCLCGHDQLHGMSIEAVKKLLVEHIRDSRAQS